MFCPEKWRWWNGSFLCCCTEYQRTFYKCPAWHPESSRQKQMLPGPVHSCWSLIHGHWLRRASFPLLSGQWLNLPSSQTIPPASSPSLGVCGVSRHQCIAGWESNPHQGQKSNSLSTEGHMHIAENYAVCKSLLENQTKGSTERDCCQFKFCARNWLTWNRNVTVWGTTHSFK